MTVFLYILTRTIPLKTDPIQLKPIIPALQYSIIVLCRITKKPISVDLIQQTSFPVPGHKCDCRENAF